MDKNEVDLVKWERLERFATIASFLLAAISLHALHASDAVVGGAIGAALACWPVLSGCNSGIPLVSWSAGVALSPWGAAVSLRGGAWLGGGAPFPTSTVTWFVLGPAAFVMAAVKASALARTTSGALVCLGSTTPSL